MSIDLEKTSVNQMSKSKQNSSHLPTKKPTKTTGTSISICIPSTAVSSKNAYNLQQQTAIAYQIVKACTIYNVAEIIILDIPTTQEEQSGNKLIFTERKRELNEDSLLLASLLQFFITPRYLIKTMFSPRFNPDFKKILPKFKYALKLPKITTLPFMQNNQVYIDFKEGIIIPKKTPKIKKKNKLVKSDRKLAISKYVNIGEAKPLKLNIKREIPIHSRVTVDLKNKVIISPSQAYGLAGHKSSFGFNVRIVDEFNKLFTQSPVKEGYSRTLYVNCDDYFVTNNVEIKEFSEEPNDSENILLMYGNINDLNENFKLDTSDMFNNLKIVDLFDEQLSIPKGCKVEDAILVSLTKLIES